MEWTWFRSVAARLGLSREEVKAVEQSGEPSWIQDPLSPEVHIRVRPDPDWTERMTDAWHGELVNSRRQSAGALPISDGRLHVGDANAPEQGVTADVVPGDYEVVLTIAHLGAEESGDYEEHVSHAFALLRGTDGVALIEPMKAEDGTEVFIEAVRMAFAGTGAFERLAAGRADGRSWRLNDVLGPDMHAAEEIDEHWSRFATSDGSDVLIAVAAGTGRDNYPLFRMTDPDGKTVGVLVDFFVDNRPY